MGKVGRGEEGLSVLAEALDCSRQNWGALLRGGAVSAQGRTHCWRQESKVKSSRVSKSQNSENPNPQSQTPDPQDRSRSVFSKSHRNCPPAASQVLGTARINEPRPLVAAARQDRAEAHKLLSDIYNWFTEGFDTKDLQEAKALLDSLASNV